MRAYVPDIDECDTGIFKCGSLQTSCVNTNGSYYCVCNAGFTGNAAVAGGCRGMDAQVGLFEFCFHFFHILGANLHVKLLVFLPILVYIPC